MNIGQKPSKGLSSVSARNMTRPDEQQRATFAADIAKAEKDVGRYSAGNQSKLFPLYVIQERSSLRPYPYCSGNVEERGGDVMGPVHPISNIPIDVSR